MSDDVSNPFSNSQNKLVGLKKMMKEGLDAKACQFGAGVMTQHIGALLAEIEGVEEAKDIEFIHRMRVASRRLRTAMALFQDCLSARKAHAWTKQIRQITRSLGTARDTDVQIDWLVVFSSQQTNNKITPGILRLILRLKQQRQKLQKGVGSTLENLQKSGILQEMRDKFTSKGNLESDDGGYSAALYRYARDSIVVNLKAMMDFDDAVHFPEKVAELHEMRIAAKQLRYSIETFLPIYPPELKKILSTIRSIQEQLGNIHDCDVWLQFLPEFLKLETQRMVDYLGNAHMMYRYAYGIRFLEQDRQAARDQQYREFIKEWDAHLKKGIWQELTNVVEAPVIDYASIYPPPAQASQKATGSSG